MLAILPNYLRSQILNTHFRGRVFKIVNVRVEEFAFDHPLYKGYMINREDWHIVVYPSTAFIPLGEISWSNFPKFPLVTSVHIVSADTGSVKNLKGNFVILEAYL